jgi:hypothetical protein
MKTKHSKFKANEGGILVLVMVVLLAFSLLTVSLLQLGRDSTVQAIQEQRNAQAHWIAEAGLEKEMALICSSRSYREGLPSGLSVELDEDFAGDATKGHYTVTVIKTDVPATAESIFDVESVGTVSNAAISATASVRVHLTGAPGIDQAILGLSGNSRIRSNVTIDSTVYQSGTLNIDANVDITSLVEAADNGTVVSGIDPAKVQTVDYINFPHIDQGPYAALTNQAAALSHSNYTGAVILNHSTNYYNGNVTITSLAGDGTVVATGTITIDSHANLQNNANLVAGGNIQFKNQSTFQGDNQIFTFGDITVDSGAEFIGAGVSLISIGGIKISANLNGFKGIIYAEGYYTGEPYGVILTPGKQSGMRGTIIAWMGFYLGQNMDITYDSSVFADPNPIDFDDHFVRTEKLLWEETPYNF